MPSDECYFPRRASAQAPGALGMVARPALPTIARLVATQDKPQRTIAKGKPPRMVASAHAYMPRSKSMHAATRASPIRLRTCSFRAIRHQALPRTAHTCSQSCQPPGPGGRAALADGHGRGWCQWWYGTPRRMVHARYSCSNRTTSATCGGAGAGSSGAAAGVSGRWDTTNTCWAHGWAQVLRQQQHHHPEHPTAMLQRQLT